MTSPNTTTGWNATAGSNLTDHSQEFTPNQGQREDLDSGEDIMAGDLNLRAIQIERSAFYRNNYDYMTGVRIAATLGGFFLFVLLTLLYKSKCKKSSREPTPIPAASPHPDLVVLSSNQTLQPIEESVPMLNRHQQLLMDPQPGPSHYGRYQSPKVLLTAAHDSSESSIESELFMNNFHSYSSLSNKCNKIPPIVGSTYTKKKSGQDSSTAAHKMSQLQQNIDIHVIQPTPTISPSGSANIFQKESLKKSKKRRGESHAVRPSATTHNSADSEPVAIGTNNPLFFLQAENLSLKYMDDTSSENIPTRGSDFEDDSGGSLGSDSVFSFERKLSSASQFTQPDEQDQDEGDMCRVTLTEAHAQVHHRDSYCSSEFESIADYLECHRRRSSSTQTTWSDLRHCLNLGPCATANISPRSSIGGGADEPAQLPNAVAATNTSVLLTPVLLNQRKATIAHISSSSSPLSNCSSRKQSIVSTQEEPIGSSTTVSTLYPNFSQMSSPAFANVTETPVIPTTSIATSTISTNTTPNEQVNRRTHMHSASHAPNSSASITATPTAVSQQEQSQQQGKNTKTFQTFKKPSSVQSEDEKHLLQE